MTPLWLMRRFRRRAEFPAQRAVLASECWEYATHQLHSGDVDFDAFGKEGWELVTISPEYFVETRTERSKRAAAYIFKRRIIDNR